MSTFKERMGPEGFAARGFLAYVIRGEILELDREVVTLMGNHASIKAAGPAHTAKHLRTMVAEHVGPRWLDLAEEYRASLFECWWRHERP